ncbi:MAG TPA: Crp/Fnr family transcriptional regulator, partial [Candidatus Polarisedimenticolia bacterium]|nr:Crp/Fnr family transcriptional regulator [Candidatus Polarisedimenticolia bacterium]
EPAKLKLLAFTSERAVFQAEEILFHQGDAADSAYIIVAGEVAIDVESPGGGSTRVAKLGKDQIVGEIGILADVPRTATVTATAPTTTLKISKELFFRMVSDFPTMAVEVMRVLAHRMETTNALLRQCEDKLAAMRRQ